LLDAVASCAKEWLQNNFPIFNHVIPAQSPGLAQAGPGNQYSKENWFPACAGMTRTDALTTFGELIQA
jgi:hypothetical protein